MSWLVELIPPTDTRQPLTLHSFFHDLLPPLLCYYATAVFVLVPRTLILRTALLPLTLWLAFRAATRLDLSLGYDTDRLAYLNQGLALALTTLCMRSITWSFQRKPFRRVKTLAGATPQFYDDHAASTDPNYNRLAIDAWDLCCNLRGCGWNWSLNLQIPAETRPTHSSAAFVSATFVSLVMHIFWFDILHYSVQSFAPSTIGSPRGGSIFDSSLAPTHRYSRSTMITFMSGLVIYCAIQMGYLFATLLGILVFRQHLSLWPPLFKSPWLSTSLTQFWAKRWHQLFRDNFISLGGYPLSLVAGRIGGVMGSFLISGILHDIGLWGMGNGSDFRKIGGFFLVNGAGIVLEHLWRKITGSRVAGFIGWIWTVAWVIGWGNILVDAWAEKGLVGSRFIPVPSRPSTFIFGALPNDTI